MKKELYAQIISENIRWCIMNDMPFVDADFESVTFPLTLEEGIFYARSHYVFQGLDDPLNFTNNEE